MAKIKLQQDSGDTVTITIAGERRLDYRVTDGHITVDKDDVDEVLRLTGGTLVDGTTAAAAPADVTEPALDKGDDLTTGDTGTRRK